RKVAPLRCFLDRHRWLAFDEERAMAAPRLSFTTRQRHIKVRPEFVNGERFADNVNRSNLIEQLTQTSRIDPIYFQIPILRLPAHQFIAHTTSDEQRA